MSRTSFRRLPSGCGSAKGCLPRRSNSTACRAPSIAGGPKCKSRPTCARSCRTSSACSSHCIAGWSRIAFVQHADPRVGDRNARRAQFHPIKCQQKSDFFNRPVRLPALSVERLGAIEFRTPTFVNSSQKSKCRKLVESELVDADFVFRWPKNSLVFFNQFSIGLCILILSSWTI